VKVGDLIKLKNHETLSHKLFIITGVTRWFVTLSGFAENQVFSKDNIEVVSYAGR